MQVIGVDLFQAIKAKNIKEDKKRYISNFG